jgi:2-keto-4-pentenoate hydratase
VAGTLREALGVARPRIAPAWLADECRALALTLAKGRIVTTGMRRRPPKIEAGDLLLAVHMVGDGRQQGDERRE